MRMILAATLAIAPLLAKDSEPVKRLDESAVVFSEVMATPDRVSRKTCWQRPTAS